MHEIHKLQQLLGADKVVTDSTREDEALFSWYRSQDGEMVGVKKTALSSDIRDMLEVFLTPLSGRPVDEDRTQQAWYELLFNSRTSTSDALQIEKGRLLHFQINSSDVEHELFVEAFQNMLSDAIIPVWRDRYSGVFVEPEHPSIASLQQLEELMSTIESDFYMKTSLFIGSPFASTQQAKEIFDKESHYYEIVSKQTERNQVHQLSTILPAYLIHEANAEDLAYLRENILKGLDEDLRKTVRTLLESDLNHTVAAKRLFIHRNSLQYRIEKFTDLTGLDPKSFQDAVTCRLLFLTFD